MVETVQEMRLFSGEGERLYLTADERARFLVAAIEGSRENRVLCSVMHFTGCRPSEALALTPASILLTEKVIVFRTAKKRKFDNQGCMKLPQYQSIPVPNKVIDDLDLVFDLRWLVRLNKEQDKPPWAMSRATTWRMIKSVMNRAGIRGKQAPAMGLRHGFGIAMLSGERALLLNILRDLMGHSDTKITEIYASAIGEERRNLVLKAWE